MARNGYFVHDDRGEGGRQRSRSRDDRSRDRSRSRERRRHRSSSRDRRPARWDRSPDYWEEDNKDNKMSKFMNYWEKGIECTLCKISVPCEETFETHLQGKDHNKRAMQHEEKLMNEGELPRDGRFGYKIGPSEMAKLSPDEQMRLDQLRKDNANISRTVQELEDKVELCERNHSTTLDTYLQEAEAANKAKDEVVRRNKDHRERLRTLRQNGAGKMKMKMKKKEEEEQEYTENFNSRADLVTIDSD